MSNKHEIKERLRDVGAVATGVSAAGPVEDAVYGEYEKWLRSGSCAGMGYLGNHLEIRRDPRFLLEGARSIVCAAFCYRPASADKLNPRIAKYAHLPDYHDWVRHRVMSSGVPELLGEEYRDWRLCIDSAPIMERYWARKSGLGWIGEQGALVVPGVGPEVVLCEILTVEELEPDEPSEGDCGGCGRCVRVCPTGALTENSFGPDCNRCLSYLTIEHRGEWIDERHIAAMDTVEGRVTLFGCDRCMSVCPHNNPEITSGIAADQRITELCSDDFREQGFGERFRGLPIKRAKAAGLRRNARMDVEFNKNGD